MYPVSSLRPSLFRHPYAVDVAVAKVRVPDRLALSPHYRRFQQRFNTIPAVGTRKASRCFHSSRFPPLPPSTWHVTELSRKVRTLHDGALGACPANQRARRTRNRAGVARVGMRNVLSCREELFRERLSKRRELAVAGSVSWLNVTRWSSISLISRYLTILAVGGGDDGGGVRATCSRIPEVGAREKLARGSRVKTGRERALVETRYCRRRYSQETCYNGERARRNYPIKLQTNRNSLPVKERKGGRLS